MGQNWAAEYLETESKAASQQHGDWAQQYLDPQGPPAGQTKLVPIPADNTKWAEEYLDQQEHKAW